MSGMIFGSTRMDAKVGVRPVPSRSTPPAVKTPERLAKAPERPERPERRVSDSASRQRIIDALAVCRVEVEMKLRGRNRASGKAGSLDGLREAVAQFAKVAASQNVPPERLLAMFKGMVGQVTDADRRPLDERNEIMTQLVQMAIESYYAERLSRAERE